LAIRLPMPPGAAPKAKAGCAASPCPGVPVRRRAGRRRRPPSGQVCRGETRRPEGLPCGRSCRTICADPPREMQMARPPAACRTLDGGARAGL
jgi:hypothetical protein